MGPWRHQIRGPSPYPPFVSLALTVDRNTNFHNIFFFAKIETHLSPRQSTNFETQYFIFSYLKTTLNKECP